MSVIIRRNQKLKDQVDIQKDLIKIQRKRKEQEDENTNNNDDFTLYIWMRKHQAFYWSEYKTFQQEF